MEDLNLEEMRSQIAVLKDKLDKQEIVSDHLLREIIKAKRGDIDKTKRVTYGAAIFCIIVYPLTALTSIWSWAFAIATSFMMILCLVATIYMHRPVDRLNFMTDDLATVARVMAKFKRQYDNWLHYITPALSIPWLVWACYEFAWKHVPEGTSPLVGIGPLLVGAAIGGIIGYFYHRKAVNAAKSIISQIEEE